MAAQTLEDTYTDGDDIATIYGFDKYLEFWESIKYLQEIIAESREHRESRLDLYCELVDSTQLKIVTDFCSALKIIESKLRKSHNVGRKNSSQWFKSQIIQMLIACGTGIAATVAVLGYAKQ